MNPETRREALKQYFRYFRWWFVSLGVLFVILLFVFGAYKVREKKNLNERVNMQAPTERVYDYADVLTDQEEDALRELIAVSEKSIQSDIVLVTINQFMGESDEEWDLAMRNYADDFYDQAGYGYDKVHGDGVLLLDNWLSGQGGGWLSTCGKVFEHFGNEDIHDVLVEVTVYAEAGDTYEAYEAYVNRVTKKMRAYNGDWTFQIPLWLVFLIPTVAAGIFMASKSKAPAGINMVTADTYVIKNSVKVLNQEDKLINQFVTRRTIPRDTDSGSGGGGRGGAHVSSGGVSHGGGGMRR